jgi:cell division protein FtsI (penicillin-binding protein 3)
VSSLSARRLLMLLFALVFALLGIVVRLGTIQVRGAEALAARGLDQRLKTVALPADRGRILDRSGAPLAISLDARDIYANPALVDDAAAEAAALGPVLGVPTDRLADALGRPGTFVYLARQVDLESANAVSAMRLPGVGWLPSTRRSYPGGSLAAQVLGFVGTDGYGLEGLEAAAEEELSGTPGELTAEISASGQEIPGGVRTLRASRPGRDVVTTLDREIQYQAQAALKQAVEDNRAKGGTIVVMDPSTGDIYAMASHPWFDPNRFTEFEAHRRRNRAVTDTWEPGSVNKVITAAAAIETGAVELDERFTVPATRQVGGFTIHDSHPHAAMQMTIGDIIAQSSNIGSSLVADRVGSARLVRFFSRFGYGRPTGVGLPGEAGGVLPDLGGWTDVTRATVSFGQGVSATPLQMASVYATLANDGVWVRPRVVRGTKDPSGRLVPLPASPTRRVLSSDTADLLTRMLAFVVQDGTGGSAQIPGYQVAGKTGTTKKLDGHGRYTNRYVASFIGFLPAAQPRVVVAAVIDEPRTIYGGIAAAPLFQDVARFAIQRLGIEAAPPVSLPPHVRDAT